MKNQSNVLFIFDEDINLENLKCNSEIFEHRQVYVISLTHNTGLKKSVYETLLNTDKGNKVIHIDFGDYFYRNSVLNKESYLKFIYEFSEKPYFNRKNLKQYFKFPFADFSTWHFSLIAEKKIDKSVSYHKLVKLLSILEIKDKFSCNEIYLDLNDRELVFTVQSNAKGKGYVFRDLRRLKDKFEFFYFIEFFTNGLRYYYNYIKRVFIIKGTLKNFKKRILSTENISYLLVEYFSYLDKSLLKETKFISLYYGPLQKAIEKKFKNGHCWLALIPDVDRKELKNNALLADKINNQGNTIFVFEEFLKIKDLFVILFQFLFISFKFILKKSILKNRFYFLGTGLNIWKIFRSDWYSSFCGKNLIEGGTYISSFNNLCSILKGHINIVYPLEMQPWEKALNIAISKNKDLNSVGIQHTAVPLLLLSYFNDKRELGGIDFIKDMPLPTRLACAGKKDFEIFKNSGWAERKLFIFGAMRFSHLKKYMNGYLSWHERENNILIALSIMQEEVKETISFVYEAFKGCRDYRIIIKPHPFCPISSLVTSLGIDLNNDIFEITDKSLNELMVKAKVMVVGGSSACFDAIACQCPVIIPRLLNFIDTNPLSGISNLPVYAASPGELREMAYNILSNKKSPLLLEECKSFIEDYCVLLDSDEEYLERIEKALIHT